MTVRRPPGRIARVKPAIRQVEPQIRDTHDPEIPLPPRDQLPSYMPPPVVRARSIGPPAQEPRSSAPPAPARGSISPRPPPPVGAPKNAELRSKLVAVNAELASLRDAARKLVLSVMARVKDPTCRAEAELVLKLVRGVAQPHNEDEEQ